jgi:hypothetical protein
MLVASAAVPCRRTSKLLRSSPYQPPAQLAMVPTSSVSRGLQPDSLQQMYMQGMMSAMMFMQPSAHGQQLPGFRLIPPTASKHPTPEVPALMNGSPEENSQDATLAAPPAATSQPAPGITELKSSQSSLFDLPAVPPKKAATAAAAVEMALASRPTNRKGQKNDDASDKGNASKSTPSAGKKKVKNNKAKAKAKDKSAGDKWAGLPSEATRRKKRPSGCSKCRYKVVGCTPSCWRK